MYRYASSFKAGLILLLLATCADAQDGAWAGFKRQTTASGSTLWQPQDAGPGPLPLLILLPMTRGTAADVVRNWYSESLPKKARERGLMVLLPSTPGSRANYAGAGAWDRTLKRYVSELDAEIADAVTRYNADPSRVVLAGFSMGGDLAWALPQRNTERYSGAIIMGSRASLRDEAALRRLTERGMRMFFFMGDSEAESRRSGSRSARDLLKKAGLDYRYAAAPGAHVTAPPWVFDQAIDFVLGAKGQAEPVLPATLAQVRAGVVEPDLVPDLEPAAPVPAAAPMADAVPATAPAAAFAGAKIVKRVGACALKPYEDEKSGLSGYRGAKGKPAIKPRFAMAGAFGADGLAQVVQDGKPGYIDCAGKFFAVTPYDNGADAFAENLVRYADKGRTGFLNRRGEAVIAAQLEWAEPFCGGLSRAGSQCTTRSDGEHAITSCKDYFYVNQKGERVPTPAVPPSPPLCGASPYTRAKTPAKLDKTCDWKPYKGKRTGLYGYKDAAGTTKVRPQFREAGAFGPDGLAPVGMDVWEWGYLNCRGHAFKVYSEGSPDKFSDDLVRTETLDGGYGFLNRKGQEVLKANYGYATPFCGGVARVGERCSIDRESDGALNKVQCDSWRLIGTDGQTVEKKIPQRCEAALKTPGGP